MEVIVCFMYSSISKNRFDKHKEKQKSKEVRGHGLSQLITVLMGNKHPFEFRPSVRCRLHR